jgi:hypothetical protein
MSTYAATTTVASEKSRNEIERTLRRYGAESFGYGWAAGDAMIAFTMNGRQIRYRLPLPDSQDVAFTRTPTRQKRSASAAKSAYEQAVRSRWRALALVIKAKLEAVETGIVSFEDEWATHMVLPDGRTVREHLFPAIAQAYETGTIPPLLALGS